jgi:mono/diheme cytochrome c family protein
MVPEMFSRRLKIMRRAFVLLACSVFPIMGNAQDDAQYRAWMKSNASSVAAIRNATDNAAAAAGAQILADNLEKIAAFWKARNVPDAVTFAQNARDAATAIVAAPGEKAPNLQKLLGACGGCHMSHRDGTAPNFRIK